MVERYGRGELNLSSVSRIVGLSREAVRNDIMRFVGAADYRRLMARRKEAQQLAREDVWVDIQEARRRLKRATREAEGTLRQESRVLSQVLREMGEAGVPLSACFTRRGQVKFALPDGRGVGIRVAVVDGRFKEHKIGFHRFKISPLTSEREFSVFAVGVGGLVVPYVFAPGELGRLRSLNLRFTDESKYDMLRKSKYDTARGDWGKLKAVVH